VSSQPSSSARVSLASTANANLAHQPCSAMRTAAPKNSNSYLCEITASCKRMRKASPKMTPLKADRFLSMLAPSARHISACLSATP
jgi:hypothetical protein